MIVDMKIIGKDRDEKKGKVSLAKQSFNWFKMCVYIPSNLSNNMFSINTMT